MTSYNEIKSEVAKWQKNIAALKQNKRNVKAHQKGEFERLLDSLVVKLSVLETNLYEINSDKLLSRRSEKVINQTLFEMSDLGARAIRKLH